jgi:hypothetical protein
MGEQEQKVFFSNDSLARFIEAQGKTVAKIVCHLWQNTINQDGTVELIDNLELQFNDKTRLTIGCTEDASALLVLDFDYKKEARELHNEFEGKIKLFAIDASTTVMWEQVIGKTLQLVKLTKNNDNYEADSIVLDFGEEKRQVSVGPLDGLVIDYFEEE